MKKSVNKFKNKLEKMQKRAAKICNKKDSRLRAIKNVLLTIGIFLGLKALNIPLSKFLITISCTENPSYEAKKVDG